MQKSSNIGLIRYEFIAYISVLDAQNVNEILLTKDDSAGMKPQSDQIKWTPVANMNVDIVDITDETGESGGSSISKILKNRICGLFDAEPLDWKYARIFVDNKAGTKHNFAIAKMPRSPIMPVIFEISE